MGEATAAATTTGSRAKLGLTLGVLSTIGPLAIDLYLPALPVMAHELGAGPNDLQRTLTVFFFALGAAQIPLGSISDRIGRKPVLYAGLALFIVASLACAASPSVETLYVLRFLQGFGVCAGTIIARAMIRDLARGAQAARLLATSFLVIGISPVLAPLLGSYLLAFTSWRGLFVLLSVAGVVALILGWRAVPESLPPAKRIPRGTPVLPAFGRVLTNRQFLCGALTAGLMSTIPFGYITAAPFIFTGVFGLDAHQYTMLLGVNAFCSIGMMQIAPTLMHRWGARTVLRLTSAGGLTVCLAIGVALWMGVLNLPLFQAGTMLVFILSGIAITPAAITALDASASAGGTAAASLGTIQLAVTASASGVVSLFPAFSVAPLMVVLAGAFLGALLLSGYCRLRPYQLL